MGRHLAFATITSLVRRENFISTAMTQFTECLPAKKSVLLFQRLINLWFVFYYLNKCINTVLEVNNISKSYLTLLKMHLYNRYGLILKFLKITHFRSNVYICHVTDCAAARLVSGQQTRT